MFQVHLRRAKKNCQQNATQSLSGSQIGNVIYITEITLLTAE